MKSTDRPTRSIVKTITYRLLIAVSNTLIVFVITRNVDLALTSGVATTVINTLLYYLHERAWNRVSWGRGK